MRRSTRDAKFSEYVAGRRPQLRRTAYLLCGESHRAEDLLQTTLMKVYANGSTSTVSTWRRAPRPRRRTATS